MSNNEENTTSWFLLIVKNLLISAALIGIAWMITDEYYPNLKEAFVLSALIFGLMVFSSHVIKKTGGIPAWLYWLFFLVEIALVAIFILAIIEPPFKTLIWPSVIAGIIIFLCLFIEGWPSKKKVTT